MKIQEISYGKSFELQGYWEKLSVKISVEENDTPETVLDSAKKTLDDWHKKTNPELYGIQIRKETEKPTLTPEETASWKALVKTLTKLGNKEDALKYLEGNKEWCLSVEAKQIANSLKPKK